MRRSSDSQRQFVTGRPARRKPPARRGVLARVILLALGLALILPLAACAPAASGKGTPHRIKVGYSTYGSDTDFRVAMNALVKKSLEEAGFDLRYADGQMKQENQIKALRTFIQQKVDAIIVVPLNTTGWDAVLTEARDAGVPVIVANRSLEVASGRPEDYYVTFIGPDNRNAGRLAFHFIESQFRNQQGPVRIVELKGSDGPNSTAERKAGFDAAMKAFPRFTLIASEAGDYTRARGKEVMEGIIQSTRATGQKIDALWAHSDDMAIGASQAMVEEGIRPGKDIVIVAVDGIRMAFEAMAAGQWNATVENPIDYGKPLTDLVNRIVAGKAAEIPKRIIMEYRLWTADQAAAELPNRKY